MAIKFHRDCPEIRNALLPDQLPQKRPKLVVTVTTMNLGSVMSYLINEKLFGIATAHVRKVELEKRGLLHGHCIFFPDRLSKQRLSAQKNMNALVCAGIPSVQDQELREMVLTHLIPKPCRPLNNPSAFCMKEGTRLKYFPKHFVNESCSPEDKYYVT